MPSKDTVPSLMARSRKNKSKLWTRASHRTRSTTKHAQEFVVQAKPADGESVVTHVYERDPKNYGETIRSSKREGWEKAMREELDARKDNEVWRLIKRPSNSNAPHTKWRYKTKTDVHGDLERLKARLVACGNEQVFWYRLPAHFCCSHGHINRIDASGFGGEVRYTC